jgi:hypothetical protein
VELLWGGEGGGRSCASEPRLDMANQDAVTRRLPDSDIYLEVSWNDIRSMSERPVFFTVRIRSTWWFSLCSVTLEQGFSALPLIYLGDLIRNY